MSTKPETPLSLRITGEDRAVLDYLCGRLGLKVPQVIRLSIRRLKEQEEFKSGPIDPSSPKQHAKRAEQKVRVT